MTDGWPITLPQTAVPLIYVRLLDGNTPATVLSPATGEFPTFLLHGQQLAFLRGQQLFVEPWHERGGRFEAGPEHALATLSFGSGWIFGAPYDAAPDGRLLAFVRTAAPQPPRIRVVIGWDRELSAHVSRPPQ